MTRTRTTGPALRTAADQRQLLLVGVCALGVLFASFAAPPAGPGPGPPDVPFPSVFGESDCSVTLDQDPVPGQEVTVTVEREAEPVTDVRVWFNGDYVGRTDERGRVTGEVPYERTLQIRVGVGESSCRFSTGTGPADEFSNVGAHATGATTAATGPAAAQFGGDDGNETGQFDTDLPIVVGVRGEPYPGEEVDLIATIDGHPVPDAAVTVAGSEAGRTAEDGTVTVRVPDDRSRYVTVRVQRGEITGERRISVQLLEVAVRSPGPLAWPGQDGEVAATVGGDPEPDAAVAVDGDGVGRTDENGTVPLALPADPTTTVSVSAGDQTASTTLLPVYAPTAGAVAFVLTLVVGVPLVAYRYGGVAGLVAAGGLFLVAGAVAVGGLLAGPRGAFAALAAAAVAALLGFLAYHRSAVYDAAGDTGSWASTLVETLTSEALWVTRRVEHAVDRAQTALGRLLAWVRDRDPSDALDAAVAWLRGLPGRLYAAVLAVLAWPGSAYRSLSSDDGSTDDDADSPAAAARDDAPVAGSTVRELWRSFASRVVPDRWPQRTPGEVSRRAIEAGFPREPVSELTAVFRDVEYGGEPLSDDRYRRARRAYDALAGASPDDEEGEES